MASSSSLSNINVDILLYNSLKLIMDKVVEGMKFQKSLTYQLAVVSDSVPMKESMHSKLTNVF